MLQIRMLRARRRELETGLRPLLLGHAGGNPGDGQGVAYGLPRQFPTLPGSVQSHERGWSSGVSRTKPGAAVKFLIDQLERTRCPQRVPLRFREAQKGEAVVAGFVQTLDHGGARESPFLRESRRRLLGQRSGLRVDHPAVVFGELLARTVFSTSYSTLFFLRAMFGSGMGAEWAAGCRSFSNTGRLAYGAWCRGALQGAVYCPWQQPATR